MNLTLTLTIDRSWTAHPALGRLLSRLPVLETPRVAGDDLDDVDNDLSELLSGMDDAPEASAPAAAPAAAPSRPPATPPAAQEWDGVPRTGKGLYKWATSRKALPAVNRIGREFNYPKMVSDWEPGQVAAAYAVLSAEPVTNGRPK
jgi:hypothetical protein